MSKTYSMAGPDGKTYSVVGPDNASMDEVKARIKAKFVPPPSPAKTMMSNLLPPDQDQPVSPDAQSVASAVTVPGRFMRSLGVGAELALPSIRSGEQQMGAADILARMKAARQPGYQPQPGEKLGAFGGQMLDPLNLAMSAILPGSGLVGAALKGGAMTAASSALDQASQGKVNYRDILKNTALGTVGSGAIHAMGTMPSGYVDKAPKIFRAITPSAKGIPEQATEMFIGNPGLETQIPQRGQALSEEVERRSGDVMDMLKQYRQGAGMYFDEAANKLKANLTPEEKILAGPIKTKDIPNAFANVKKNIEAISRPVQENPNFPMNPERKAAIEAASQQAVPTLFKRLLHIRQSIDHWVDYPDSTGVNEISGVQEGGLKLLRKQVNDTIAALPGGEVLRNADGVVAGAKAIFGKLQPYMKRPGEALEFLKNTFSGNGPNAKEDMMNLLALEKATRKPVVNDLFKALTMSHFSKNLAGDAVSRTVAGASPFLISAMFRSFGLPFQPAFWTSAAGATAAQSPRLLGATLRGAQKYGPAIEAMAKPSAVAMLDALRGRNRGKKPVPTP